MYCIRNILKETESLTIAHLLAVCSASWSVTEMNGVQCFTSSSLSFSIEQLTSKGRKKKFSWLNPVPLASFNTGAVEDVCGVVLGSWWHSQWRLDWWAWCVLIWNKILVNLSMYQ